MYFLVVLLVLLIQKPKKLRRLFVTPPGVAITVEEIEDHSKFFCRR
jgi:hypothetical protein